MEKTEIDESWTNRKLRQQKRLSKSTAVLKKNQSNLMCEQETTSWPP